MTCRTRALGIAIAALVLASVFAQQADAQQATTISDPLPYSRGFLVTGDYAIAGVDFTSQANPADANGLSTGTLTVTGVPDDADIVAAYLYWEEIFTASPGMIPSAGIKFRGSAISPTAIKASSFRLSTNPATCWGAAGTSGAVVADFRADVLYLLPKRFDANDAWTGKYFVNGPHTVTLPEVNGNKAVQTAGATLVIVYRTFSNPLKKIVIYDGAYPQAEGTTITQRLRAFYKSVASNSGTLSYIVGTGGNNQTEQVLFNGAVVSAADPFPQTSPSSDRSWANPTYTGLTMTGSGGASNDPFGETVTTSLAAAAAPAACRSIAAIIFSTRVADADGDGLPDGLEDASKGLSDPPTIASPNGTPLPNLNKMGASSSHKDLFIEVNAMWAPPGTSYGSATAPYSSSITTLTDVAGHNHMPTPDVLKMVGDAYAAHGITAHFDVGNLTAYQSLGPGYTCDAGHPECDASAYFVPSSFARGGEEIQEQACSAANVNALNCEFPDFPGTVGWKIGLQLYRDAPVADNGGEISVATAKATWKSGQHRRRFDPIRADYFHYLLYAHARGKPKSSLPCLNAGVPSPYDTSGACGSGLTDNPDYHVPLSTSGVADLPGGDVLITLGLWENFVGTAFVRASTTLHELGHNLNLWHGGVPAIWGDKAAGTSTYVEPNCKPNYLSSMNYLFQVHGLFDDAGKLHLDYSSAEQGALDERSLFDAPFSPAPAYVPAWFAPANSQLALIEGVSPASRFCNGAKFGEILPAAKARVTGSSTTAPVDWNGDLLVDATAQQNVNFDGTADGVSVITTELKPFDDWSNIRLDQISSGRNEVKYSDGDFLDVGAGDFLDVGSGDFLDIGAGDFLDFGSGDFLDVGAGDFLDFGSGDFLDVASGDFLDFGAGDFMDIGSGDFLDVGAGDFLDVGAGDFLDVGAGSSQELDFDRARAIGRAAAYGVNGCVINGPGCITVRPSDPTANHVLLRWTPPPFGQVAQYLIFRKDGDASSTNPYSRIGTTTATTFVDPEQLPVGKTFTYYVQTEFSDEVPHTFSGTSNLAVVVIVKK